ncbi:uncharacterized protein LOC126791326 [Argentina anserina]|uniref:uncharacterized protein LOC126791326 n=1 Tax=Argentina anserina TaxID=57926 RepID=UPI00217640FE|nr:uncharacterized protein LOC126791326 [Potentilla anserina]
MEHKNMNINNSMEGEEGYNVVLVHMQVMKIKQEFEKIKHPSLSVEQPAEMRRLLLREFHRQRSRSPLGLAAV